jgi:hypothetical protein
MISQDARYQAIRSKSRARREDDVLGILDSAAEAAKEVI